MSMWFDAKKKSYARCGPNAWLRTYVEHLVTALQEALFAETEARRKTDEKVAEEVQKRETDDLAIVQEMRSLNIQNGSGEKSLQGGTSCEATSANSVALGLGTQSNQAEMLVHGCYNEPLTNGEYLHVVGNGTGNTARANAYTLDRAGNGWFQGEVTVGQNREKLATEAQVGPASRAIANIEGKEIPLSEGKAVVAKEGAIVVGDVDNNVATGRYAMGTGANTKATGDSSTAMGYYSEANGDYSFAAGEIVAANGHSSMVMGSESTTNGEASVALGRWAVANGEDSLAVLGGTTGEDASFGVAIGQGTQATAPHQVVLGKYNEDVLEGKNIFVVGNGTAQKPSNAFSVNESGDGWFKGEVFIGNDKNGLATINYVDEKIEELKTMLAAQQNLAENNKA